MGNELWVPVILLAVAVISASYVAYEILRYIAGLLCYLDRVASFGVLVNADLRWWMDARYSLIPAERDAAVEMLADVYGIEPEAARS